MKHNCQFCGEYTEDVAFFGKDWSCFLCLHVHGIEDHPLCGEHKYLKWKVEIKEIPCNNELRQDNIEVWGRSLGMSGEAIIEAKRRRIVTFWGLRQFQLLNFPRAEDYLDYYY